MWRFLCNVMDVFCFLQGQKIAIQGPRLWDRLWQVVRSTSCASSCFWEDEGSNLLGGLQVEGVVISNAKSGIRMKTTAGRGGYITNVSISEVEMHNTEKAIVFSGFSGEHPDDHWDRHAYPLVERILIQNVVGENIVQAGELLGLQEAPFRHICLINIALDVLPGSPCWNCSEVAGSSSFVLPKPCPELQDPELSSSRRWRGLMNDFDFPILSLPCRFLDCQSHGTSTIFDTTQMSWRCWKPTVFL